MNGGHRRGYAKKSHAALFGLLETLHFVYVFANVEPSLFRPLHFYGHSAGVFGSHEIQALHVTCTDSGKSRTDNLAFNGEAASREDAQCRLV